MSETSRMAITIKVPADPRARFAADAFRSQIGKTITVNLPERSTTGVILAAKVIEGGAYAEVTLDVDDAALPGADRVAPMSFGFGVDEADDE